MWKAWLAALLLSVSTAASACPLCLGAGQRSTAHQLVDAHQVVLAVRTAEPDQFRVIEVVKGERPSSRTIEGGYSRFGPASDDAASKRRTTFVLVHDDDALPVWTILGAIGTEHLSWLRKVAAGKEPEEMSAEQWRTRIGLVVPYLEHPTPMIARIAYEELAAAPYAAIRTTKPRLSASAVRTWLADPELAGRRSLYLLLLGVVGDERDAARLEQRMEAAWKAGDATDLGPMIAADLELRGPSRMDWIDERYLRDPKRSTLELETVVRALGVHGNTDRAIPRKRVIESYRVFMQANKPLAGLVASDLAAWQYWDAVPDYVALMSSGVKQSYASRAAITAYLRQSPNATSVQK